MVAVVICQCGRDNVEAGGHMIPLQVDMKGPGSKDIRWLETWGDDCIGAGTDSAHGKCSEGG